MYQRAMAKQPSELQPQEIPDVVKAHSCIDASSEIHWWAMHNY